MKERTKEELLAIYNDPFRRNYVTCEIIDPLLVEIEKPKLWDKAPAWATHLMVTAMDDKGKQDWCNYFRTLPKTRADELAKEKSKFYLDQDGFICMGREQYENDVSDAILRREKELEEGR